ncbi:hypothetical protein TNCV_3167921 [Trichonephila clavipes]|uniref:Uncharacterized protein n=1 Tax=Trichonephila clavipes TaxID=2585209 RepID=A0A8X6USL2_TRICX|nr:hypothetical protein TNCV_3167921 [Trichonephila clavipes]
MALSDSLPQINLGVQGGTQGVPHNSKFEKHLRSKKTRNISDEHGDCFDQDMANMEKRYQGNWTTAVLAAHYWTFLRDALHVHYKRHIKRIQKS